MTYTHYLLERQIVIHLARLKFQNILLGRFNCINSSVVAAFTTTTPSFKPSGQSNGLSEVGKQGFIVPESISPAGTVLRGLNYLKGRDDPISLKEEEYPPWLWGLLDEKKKQSSSSNEDSDLFSKSKKLRRKAAKKQRKLEALRQATGNFEEVQVPMTQQSIDLPSNEEGTLEGAKRAEETRKQLRAAMRDERRKKIKEKNYLRSV